MKRWLIFLSGVTIGVVGSLAILGHFKALEAVFRPKEVDVAPKPIEVVKLLFVGDIMPSRGVDKQMMAFSYDFPFEKLRGLLKNADVTFANLESPVTHGRTVQSGEMRFRTDPEFLPYLRRAGVSVVSVANNHMGDEGESGVRETLAHLAENGIVAVGAGTSSEAYTPRYVTVGSTTIAYIAENDTTPVPPSYCASDTLAGSACFDFWRLAEAIDEARAYADFVVISMHAGTEYTSVPNDIQRRFAHAAIGLGADLVIGTHPHWIQSREFYKGKWIYYSLGNFIFDQEWSRDTKLGLALEVDVVKASSTIVRMTHTIIRVDEFAQPRVATDEEAGDMYQYLELP